MQIGLIGGIGPAATDYYYRRLIEEFASRNMPLELTIVHADAPTLLHNLESNDVEAQVKIYNRLSSQLVSVGAKCMAVSAIALLFMLMRLSVIQLVYFRANAHNNMLNRHSSSVRIHAVRY